MIDADCINSFNRVLLVVPAERHAAAARRIMVFVSRERQRERAQEGESEIREKLRVESSLQKQRKECFATCVFSFFFNLDLNYSASS